MISSSTQPVRSLRTLRPHEVGPLVRLGRDFDGGYVIPAVALEASEVLLGIGIHDDWSFEQDFKRHQPRAKVVGVDGSAGLPLLLRRALPRIFQVIGAILLLDFKRAATKYSYFQKLPSFIRFFGKEVFLRKMLVARPAPGGITLAELFQTYAPPPVATAGPNVFVKIDIEGAEYDLLRGDDPVFRQTACLVVEFHGLADNWASFLAITASLAPAFVVAHVHGNNYEPLLPGTGIPSAIEVTWLNRKLAPAPTAPSLRRYPLENLDQPCNAKMPDYALKFGDGDEVAAV